MSHIRSTKLLVATLVSILSIALIACTGGGVTPSTQNPSQPSPNASAEDSANDQQPRLSKTPSEDLADFQPGPSPTTPNTGKLNPGDGTSQPVEPPTNMATSEEAIQTYFRLLEERNSFDLGTVERLASRIQPGDLQSVRDWSWVLTRIADRKVTLLNTLRPPDAIKNEHSDYLETQLRSRDFYEEYSTKVSRSNSFDLMLSKIKEMSESSELPIIDESDLKACNALREIAKGLVPRTDLTCRPTSLWGLPEPLTAAIAKTTVLEPTVTIIESDPFLQCNRRDIRTSEKQDNCPDLSAINELFVPLLEQEFQVKLERKVSPGGPYNLRYFAGEIFDSSFADRSNGTIEVHSVLIPTVGTVNLDRKQTVTKFVRVIESFGGIAKPTSTSVVLKTVEFSNLEIRGRRIIEGRLNEHPGADRISIYVLLPAS